MIPRYSNNLDEQSPWRQEPEMDREYINRTIENLKKERAVHDQKFASNVAHQGCLPRFDQAIENLRKELEKLESKSSET
jgi:SOS response regulatory protein OraA/RecX